MRDGVELLLGLLDADGPAAVAQEDLAGPGGPVLRRCQDLGFLGREPLSNPVPGCPRCAEGAPYRLGARYVCNHCRSLIDPRELLLWPLDRDAFLGWLAGRLTLTGGVRRIDDALWQLGTRAEQGDVRECFYRGVHPLSEPARARLGAYRSVLVFHGLSAPPADDAPSGSRLSLLEVLRPGESLEVADLATLLRPAGAVRFDEHTGTLWAGDAPLGEVPF